MWKLELVLNILSIILEYSIQNILLLVFFKRKQNFQNIQNFTKNIFITIYNALSFGWFSAAFWETIFYYQAQRQKGYGKT